MRIALRSGTALLVVALLVGCGADDTTAEPGEQATSRDTSEPTPGPGTTLPNGPIDFTRIALISESNVDGTVDARATVLDSRAAVDEFARTFSGSQMGEALDREYQNADVAEGEILVGAVVGVSCQPPGKLKVEKTEQGVEITATAKISKVQCLVPVTTVALVSVPEAAV